MLIHKSALIQKRRSFNLLRCDTIASPFSFFHFILIPGNFNDPSKLERILIHEVEHVRQKHSLDILIMQLLTIAQWCNPFVWLIRRLVRENHEFLADKAVLNRGFSLSGYKILLLSQIAGDGFLLTNNFNYSLIKTRIRMMSKAKSSKIALVRSFTCIVIGILLLVTVRLHADTLNPETLLWNNQSINSVFSFVNRISGLEKNSNSLQLGLKNAGYRGSGEFILQRKKSLHTTSQNITREVAVLCVPICQNVDEKPRFKDGNAGLIVSRVYPIGKNDNYSRDFVPTNSHAEIEGVFYLKTLIDKNGNVLRAEVLKSSHCTLSNNLLRVIANSKELNRLNIISGKKDGKPVNSIFTFPVTVMAQCK
jgi:hypothetical protein